MHSKGVREYFERIANIETGSGDEILIFASSRCETIFISMWNNFHLNMEQFSFEHDLQGHDTNRRKG